MRRYGPASRRAIACLAALLAAMAVAGADAGTPPDTCENIVRALNRTLRPGIDEAELVIALRSLNNGDGLPPKFVTKGKATRSGWRPGNDLWGIPSLRGKSIGGDRFGNREGRLPRAPGGWREADLDYRGGRRGAKRLVYSPEGKRMVTVDHYSTFTEVPVCR